MAGDTFTATTLTFVRTDDGQKVRVEAGQRVPDNAVPGSLDRLVASGAVQKGELPDVSVDEVLAGVGDDKEKAAAALQTEIARSRPRKTLVEKLEAVLAGGGAPDA